MYINGEAQYGKLRLLLRRTCLGGFVKIRILHKCRTQRQVAGFSEGSKRDCSNVHACQVFARQLYRGGGDRFGSGRPI